MYSDSYLDSSRNKVHRDINRVVINNFSGETRSVDSMVEMVFNLKAFINPDKKLERKNKVTRNRSVHGHGNPK